MPHLRPPAARADRREGGRHGRPGGRSAIRLPQAHIRTQLLRLAVLPSAAVALCACAAVLYTVRSTTRRPDPVLWAVLAAAATVVLAALVIAAVAADRAARTVHDRVGTLRRGVVRGRAEIRDVLDALNRGEKPPAHRASARRGRSPGPDPDVFDLLSGELLRAHEAAVDAVLEAARLNGPRDGRRDLPAAALPAGRTVEVFANLARRLQSLVHRQISILDDLEDQNEDPDLLKSLFHIDHLATRTRRHAENLAVLGGAVSRRQWSSPVPVTEVLRSAAAEVEQYERVRLVPPTGGTLRGHAVADVVHLLAELIENATVFSPPHTYVLLRVDAVTSGLAVEVEDQGLGMPAGEQKRMNALLREPDRPAAAGPLQDGRIGLYVVSHLARRHGISVRLGSNIYGGIQAVLVLPRELLGTDGRTRPAEGPQRANPVGAAPTTEPTTGPEDRDRPNGTPHQRHPGAAPAHAPASEPAPRTAPVPTEPPPRPDATPSRAETRHHPEVTPSDEPLGPYTGEPFPTHGDHPARNTGQRPELPKRHAQQHLAPRLREGAWPPQKTEPFVGHDPGLMAAFRRGFSLGETHLDGATAPGQAQGDDQRHGPVARPGHDLEQELGARHDGR